MWSVRQTKAQKYPLRICMTQRGISLAAQQPRQADESIQTEKYTPQHTLRERAHGLMGGGSVRAGGKLTCE
jgi:hypothetical protein